MYDTISGYHTQAKHLEDEKGAVPSVKDSLKTLAICKKINKTLTQKQKIVVLIKLLELVSSDKNFSIQRMEIVNTVSTVFNIAQGEYKLIEAFVLSENISALDLPDILIVNENSKTSGSKQKHIHAHLDGNLVFLKVSSVGMYFVKYLGADSTNLNREEMPYTIVIWLVSSPMRCTL